MLLDSADDFISLNLLADDLNADLYGVYVQLVVSILVGIYLTYRLNFRYLLMFFIFIKAVICVVYLVLP